MKTFLAVIGILCLFALGGFCIWTEAKHDKPFWTFIKDEIQESKDEKQANDVDDEVIIEENGEATAVIKL